MAQGEHEEAETADPMVGRMIGNHVVEKKLGEGGMGAVYLLKHVRLPDTYAALKVMTAADSEEMKARFEQEALVAAAVGSHRVARPMDMGTLEDGTAYIVMEFVPGRSLGEHLRESGALDVTSALKIACRVADTLVIAHEKEIVHRDIKPPNIMLVSDGERETAIKLLDFGVARATGALKLARTAHSVIVGTPGYMSPEAVAGADVDGRTDVFSLGVVIYQMLAGRIPFGGSSAQEVMTRVLTDPAPTIASKRRPELPPIAAEVEAVVARALAKQPADRYTMAELRGALTALLEDGEAGMMMSVVRSPTPGAFPLSRKVGEPDLGRATPPPASGAMAATPPPDRASALMDGVPAGSSSRRLVIAICALAALGLCGGAWWLLRDHGAPAPSANAVAPIPSPTPTQAPPPEAAKVPALPPPVVPAPHQEPVALPVAAPPPVRPAVAPPVTGRGHSTTHSGHSSSGKKPARSADEDELK